jgi:hypothetical protein
MLQFVFELIENMGKTELSDSSRHLIAGYWSDAAGESPADRVRATVHRYLGQDVPTLEQVREKSRTSRLSALDHLVLKMEFESSRAR